MKDTYTAAEARELFSKEKKPLRIKPEKKPDNTLNISTSESEAALDAITINRKAEYVEYEAQEPGKPGQKYIYYRLKATGQMWRVKPERVPETDT